MSDGTIEDTAAEPTLRTLADKVNWLIDQARPAGHGPLTNAEVAVLIERATGEQASHTTVWKLRNGQAANPQMKLLAALTRTFGVHPGFFFDDFDENQARRAGWSSLKLPPLIRPTYRVLLRQCR